MPSMSKLTMSAVTASARQLGNERDERVQEPMFLSALWFQVLWVRPTGDCGVDYTACLVTKQRAAVPRVHSLTSLTIMKCTNWGFLCAFFLFNGTLGH